MRARLRAYGLSAYFQRRIVTYLLVVVILVMGAIAGGIASRAVDTASRSELLAYIEDVLTAAPESSPPEGTDFFAEALSGEVARTALVMWLLGLTVIGAPLILALTFLRGFSLGFTLTFMVEELLSRGVLLAVAAILPQNLLVLPGTVLAAAAGLSFAGAAARILGGRRRGERIYRHLAVSAAAAAAAGVLLIGGAFVETYVTPRFITWVAQYTL